jgi:cytochrome c-type biogenesis protein CcmH/NrfG
LRKGEDYYLLGKMKYESDPANVKYINELAKQAQVLNRYEEAVELWLQLLSLLEADPGSPGYLEIARVSYGEPLSEIYIQLAAAYLMLDRYEEALSASRKAVQTGTKRKEYIHIYAHCEIVAGSSDRAFSALQALLEATPDYAPALFMTAVILCLKGETEKAREGFESLVRSHVQITPSLNKIARQLHAHSRKDEAFLILDAAMENRLNDEETRCLLESFRENRAADSPV